MLAPNTPLWEDGRWSPLPSLVGDVDADVCVVGLGGSGLAAVDELRALGARVVGLDSGSIAGGASGRNGGFLRAGLALQHHEAVARLGRERAVALYKLTALERERMLSDTPRSTRRSGYFRRAWDAAEERDCRAQLDAMRGDDLPVTWYDGPHGHGLLVTDDAACNPLARCRELAGRLTTSGAILHEQSRAVTIRAEVVETEQGRVRCRGVVVAVDGGLAGVLPELSEATRSVRLQMLGTSPDAGYALPFATGMRWGWDYFQQEPSGEIALGGCRDVGGEAEFTHDASPTALVQDALERRLRVDLGVVAPVTHRWAAAVSYTADTLPVLREVSPRVWAVGAYSGTGNLLGGALARVAARRALGMRAAWPLDP